MPTILLTAQSARTDSIRAHIRAAGWEVRESDVGPASTEDELIAAGAGAEAVIAGAEPYTRRVIEASRLLRVISRCGIGYDSIDVDAATECGVAVCTSVGSNDRTVADFAVMAMIALARRLIPAHRSMVEQKVFSRPPGAIDFSSKTVGIIGTGAIGRRVAQRVRAFECRLLGYDTKPDAALASLYDLSYVSLETLLSESDFVTLHVPLLHATRNLIGERELRLMKHSAFLINTARGPIVDQDALHAALASRTIAGAALDVFREEPLPPEHPLRAMENALLTPHVAGRTAESDERSGVIAVDNAINVLRSQQPGSCLNPSVLELHARL